MKKSSKKMGAFRRTILASGFALGFFWILAIGTSLWWNLKNYEASMLELAATGARASFNKDLVYRRWAAEHGGVYVPSTKDTPPNPYLKGMHERDITTPSGKDLTLVNPAYMTRQVFEIALLQYGVRAHLTSLDPIRPENFPDEWERQALQTFEKGESEVQGLSNIDGVDYLRLMQPMLTEKPCLKCHGYQNYKVGDIRGGLSVSVPMARYYDIAEDHTISQVAIHFAILILGLGGIFFAFMTLGRQEKRRALTQRALEESDETARALLNANTESAFLLALDGTFLIMNDVTATRLGSTVEEILGKCAYDFLPEEIATFRKGKVEQVVRTKKGMRFVDKRGDLVFDHSIYPLFDSSGEVNRLAIFSQDVTSRILAEETLKKDLELNRAIAEISQELLSESYGIGAVSDVTLKVVLSITDSEQGFVSCIDEKTKDNVGHTSTDMFRSSCMVDIQRIFSSIGDDGRYVGLGEQALNARKAMYVNSPPEQPNPLGLIKDSPLLTNFLAVPVMIGDSLLGLIALANSVHDYSDKDVAAVQRVADVFALAIHRQDYEVQRMEMDQRLRQLQKNEAIGSLAGGIAHDFNNILTPIIGYSEILKEDIPKESSMRESIEQVLLAATRAKDLVKQILTISRQHAQEIVHLRPHLIIKEVVKLIQSTIPSTIKVTQNIDTDCRSIIADPTQIHQLAMNLLTNAYHSMEADGGVLTISLQNVDIAEADNTLDLTPGSYVVLSVGDTGGGIDADHMDKIFDPYYSTKPMGKGTGLGLPVVYGIVKKYKGEVEVENLPGQGIKFKVYLPAVEEQPVIDPGLIERFQLKGTEKILLVDDELAVLKLESQLLERYGYHIETMDNSKEAFLELKNNPGKYDLLITDMTMPEMTGDQLTQEIRKVNSKLSIIICTGFSKTMTPERAKAIGADGMLMKPVGGIEMARMVKEVLDKAKKIE